MTILALWCFIAKSFKNVAGGKENASAIARAIVNITKTLLFQAMMSYQSRCIWTIDNTPLYYKLLYVPEQGGL